MRSTRRFAIYFAPPATSVLTRFGNRLLGRNATTGRALKQPAVPGIDPARLKEITASPRYYGLHATLKPPFVLAPGYAADEIYAAAAAFAQTRRAFALPRLEIRPLAGFLALRPGTACDDLDRLAADCVRGFDHLRAPSLEADLARLRGLGLTANQEAMQVAWGYPFVFDEFRFHITLTDRLEAAERQRAHQALAPFVDPICAEPQMVDAICIFEQRNVGDPFRITKRFAFHP